MNQALVNLVAADKGRFVEIQHGDVIFEVREPSAGAVARYSEACSKENVTQSEIVTALAALTISCVYGPDGARVFDDDEKSVQVLLGSRGLAIRFRDEVLKLVQSGPEIAGKTSEETLNSASDSSSESSSG